MRPVKFQHQNVTFAEDQPEYIPLPALRLDDEARTVITKWKPSIRDRIRILFGASIWHSQMTFGHPLQPIHMTTVRKEAYMTHEEALMEQVERKQP